MTTPTGATKPEIGPVAEQGRFESLEENRISVPERIARYHQLVREMRARTSDQRRTWSRGTTLDVSVTEASLPRAKRLMDTLIRALERRGFPLRVEDGGGTFVSVHGIDVQIKLSEQNRRVQLPPDHPDWTSWSNYHVRGTGRLKLEIDTSYADGLQKSWADGRQQRVEDCLNDFVVGLVAVAESERERELRWAETWAYHEEEARQARERRRAAEDLRQRGEKLKADARAWEEAALVTRYVAAIREAAAPSPSRAVSDWLSWAEGYARSVNPLTAGLPKL